MPPRTREIHSSLYTVRVWIEEVSDGRTEWRGKVQRVITGETLYFHDWDTMLAFLREDDWPPTPDARTVMNDK
jgi:hypothetical protein